MAPVTALLYCYRLETITPVQFRTHIEEVHDSLVRSLLTDAHPTTHTRYYIDKESGFQLGSPVPGEADLIAVITYDSQEHMEESMKRRMADGNRELIEADEARFMDRSKVRLVLLGPDHVSHSTRA